jgi:hypothetical protein
MARGQSSQQWQQLKEHYERKLDKLRDDLEKATSFEEVKELQGRIAEIRSLLKLEATCEEVLNRAR